MTPPTGHRATRLRENRAHQTCGKTRHDAFRPDVPNRQFFAPHRALSYRPTIPRRKFRPSRPQHPRPTVPSRSGPTPTTNRPNRPFHGGNYGHPDRNIPCRPFRAAPTPTASLPDRPFPAEVPAIQFRDIFPTDRSITEAPCRNVDPADRSAGPRPSRTATIRRPAFTCTKKDRRSRWSCFFQAAAVSRSTRAPRPAPGRNRVPA